MPFHLALTKPLELVRTVEYGACVPSVKPSLMSSSRSAEDLPVGAASRSTGQLDATFSQRALARAAQRLLQDEASQPP